jgi:hypothetical protein
MPTQKARQSARRKARAGKNPTTQAGEFVKEEMHRYKHGARDIKSRKQAVAIGLSEARRAGVKLGPPKKGSAKTRKKAARDSAVGAGKHKPSPARSRGARKAAAKRKRSGKKSKS